MPKFRVDVRVDASIYVEAESEDEARMIALSPLVEDLVEEDSFFADAVRIDSIHDASDWPHRCLNKNSDSVWIEYEADDDAFELVEDDDDSDD